MKEPWKLRSKIFSYVNRLFSRSRHRPGPARNEYPENYSTEHFDHFVVLRGKTKKTKPRHSRALSFESSHQKTKNLA